MERAQTQIIAVLPLAAPALMAGARMNSLQGRWAHQVMRGRPYYHDERLTRAQIQNNRRADLGWTHLCDTAKVHTILLYQRMRNELKAQPHKQWARQIPLPKGTWVAYARSLQDRLGIPDTQIPNGGWGRTRPARHKGNSHSSSMQSMWCNQQSKHKALLPRHNKHSLGYGNTRA